MEWADNRKSVGRNLLEYPVCDRFTFLCLNWMKELSAFTTTDARNEASVILAKKIFEHDIEFPVLEEKQGTLQQNFTRFAMRWLRDAGKKNPKLSWIREIKIWLPCI